MCQDRQDGRDSGDRQDPSGLIQEERNGTTINYSLNLSVAEEALAAVMDLLGTGGKDSPVIEEER